MAAWHSLIWLVVANAVGVLLATLLLFPRLNAFLGDWTYGRWMPVHMNLQLYGWCSLPLVAFLIHLYGADRGAAAVWCRPVLWVWSAALGVGALSWLSGHSSGKLFLDWTGYPRILFPLALIALWCLLSWSLVQGWNEPGNGSSLARSTKVAALGLLLLAPPLIYVASSPTIYPPINPDTGGPTGASQLESTLVIVGILLLIPYGLSKRKPFRLRGLMLCWIVFALEAVLCLGLGRADVSHHRPIQYISLGSLLVWLPLMPVYYNAFAWNANTHRWRMAFLCWWSVLVPTGWCLFLSSLLVFVLVQLLGEDGWIFNRSLSFYVWQISVGAYVVLMFVAGWVEGLQPAFSMVPSFARNAIYLLRLGLGVLLFLASLEWWSDASKLLRGPEGAEASRYGARPI
jgi:cytochrome c oxidase cbb3-type subunit 1